MSKYYTGIGARNVPQEEYTLCTEIAKKLSSLDYICRSGGAKGCDTAFQKGASRFEIYRPNKTYLKENRQRRKILNTDWTIARDMSAMIHPAWNNLSEYVKDLHTRNFFQLRGTKAINSSFVICWTFDGAQTADETSNKTGGTGQAIRLADYYSIPVFNLSNEESRKRIETWIGS